MTSRLGFGCGLWPGFGQQPDSAPEASLEQQPPQPVNAVADYADPPSASANCRDDGPTAPWAASAGCLGQPCGHGRLPPWCHRPRPAAWPPRARPVAGDARRVRSPGLVPLPAQALEGLEAQFYPEAQGVPTGPCLRRRKVGQDPRLLLPGVPDRQQGATAFGGGGGKRYPTDPAVSGRGTKARPAACGLPGHRK